jgi:hypothetical protein
VRCIDFVGAVVLAVLVGTCASAQTETGSQPREQAEFGAEDEHPRRPVKVPEAVLQTLRRVDEASPNEMPETSLMCSEIHLGGSEETDLIVMGVGNLRLPHGALFWVFRKNRDQYELILTTGGDTLTVLAGRWKGHRKIRVRNHSARTITTTTYRFDGKSYREFDERESPIR